MTKTKRMKAPQCPVAEGAHTDFRGEMSYGDYLRLDQLLSAQKPLGRSHDEMLFIIQHQTSELWIKLILHELDAAIKQVQRGDLPPMFKMMARVSRVQQQLVSAWDVLSTMTPADYLSFRGDLGHASGFQSHQYRLLEYKLGNKNAAMLKPHAHKPQVYEELERALKAPSLYDEAVMLLARRGFKIAKSRLSRDWSRPAAPDQSVAEAWLKIYSDTKKHWDLYEMAEELVDVEDGFRQWRFRHVTTVERVMGFKRGTGGTSGVAYLREALNIRLFPELWNIRTDL